MKKEEIDLREHTENKECTCSHKKKEPVGSRSKKADQSFESD